MGQTLIPLLADKFHIPPFRPQSIHRSRLHAMLQNGIHQRLTLISAPAGFGKTTLVSKWLATLDRPVVWLTLDANDNDFVWFLQYLIASFQRLDPSIGQTLVTMLQSGMLPPIETLGTQLVSDLKKAALPCVAVLDDYHVIHNQQVHRLVSFWLDHKPPDCHVILLGRFDPPFSLSKWRVNGELNEIRESDLRFTLAESTQFLQQVKGLNLTTELIEAINQRTEGWIASLHLAVLSLRNQPDSASFVATFTGSHRYIVDYLTDEVLNHLAAPLRDFLRQTSILERFTADLCNAVTGGDNGQALLQQLEDENLFLSPLDHQSRWYRYHSLFAESLRTTLSLNELAMLHNRASAWFKTNDMMEQAIYHARCAAEASGNLDYFEQLVVLVAEDLIHHGRLGTVQEWLSAFPDAYIRSRGQLAMLMAWMLALSSKLSLSDEYAQAAEMEFRRSASYAGELGKTLVLRSTIAVARYNAVLALQCATDGLTLLGEQHRYWQTIAHWAIGNAHEFIGSHIQEAIDSLTQGVRLSEGYDLRLFSVVTQSSLAAAYYFHGQRHQSLEVCNTALRSIIHRSGTILPVASNLLARRGVLKYEANDVAGAWNDLEQAVTLSQQAGLESQIILCMAHHSLVQFARGDQETAVETLHSLFLRSQQSGYWESLWFSAWEIDLRLRFGDKDAARQWLAVCGLTPTENFTFTRMEAYLTYGRVLMVCEPPEKAAAWLTRLESYLAGRGLNRWLLTTYLLQVQTCALLNRQAQAVDYLTRAIALAAPEGFYRPFLDEDVRALLPQVRAAAPAFVDTLLAVVEQPKPPQPDLLSLRELEVLALMAEGQSNQEIAARLSITVGTVKRHIHNILEKLDVSNRMHAVMRAQELKLL